MREVSLPHGKHSVAVYYILATAEASSNLARYDGVKYGHRAADARDLIEQYRRSRAEGFGPEVRRRIMLGTYALSSGYYDAYYRKAQQVRTLILDDFTAAFREVDLLAGPTAPTAAFRIGEKSDDPLQMYLSDIFTISVNLAGVPGLSVPCGFTAAGLPIGLQLIGPAFARRRCCAPATPTSSRPTGTRGGRKWGQIYSPRRLPGTSRQTTVENESVRISERYEIVIGLEVHAQLLTRTKIFCGCPTDFGAPANTHVCPVCLGLPGVLPVLNRAAVECIVRTGLALGCAIAPASRFARKNYFYPDLPKGYQISQYELPVCVGGGVPVGEGAAARTVPLTRIHLEEDAGKLIHGENLGDPRRSFVDLNRAGVPLMEIVGEPALRSAAEARDYLVALRDILVHLGVCDGNMEQGSFRCDANVSLRPRGQAALGTKVELKNMNSFRYVQQALEYEVARQEAILDEGGDDRPGDPPLRPEGRHDALDAAQGGGARLPLLPRAGPRAARDRRRLGRAGARRAPRAAGRAPAPLRRGARPARVRRRRAHRRPGARRLVRGGGGRVPAAEDGQQLGHGRAAAPAARLGEGDRRVPGAAGRAGGAAGGGRGGDDHPQGSPRAPSRRCSARGRRRPP